MRDFVYYRGVMYVASQQWLTEFDYLLRVSMTLEDAYQVLGVPRGASPAEINKAYHNLVKLWHPDRNPDKPDAHQKMVEINVAKDICDGKRRPDFGGYSAPPPPPRTPRPEFYTISFDDAAHAAHSTSGVQWCAVSSRRYDEVIPTADIKQHMVTGWVAVGFRTTYSGADFYAVAAYHTLKQVMNAYQNKTWSTWRLVSRSWPLTTVLEPREVQQRVEEIWGEIQFPSTKNPPTSLYLLPDGTDTLTQDLPDHFQGAPRRFEDLAQIITARSRPTPRVEKTERTFDEAVKRAYYDEVNQVEWRLVTAPITVYGPNHSITKPDQRHGFVAYGVSNEHHVWLGAVHSRHYDDSGAPYGPIYDEDVWSVEILSEPFSLRGLSRMLELKFEKMFDYVDGGYRSPPWTDKVRRVPVGVTLDEHLPTRGTGAEMTCAEAALKLPVAYKRELRQVTLEQALAVEALPSGLKWLFHTRRFTTKGPQHSATEADTRSAVIVAGKTSTNFVFATIRHVVLNALKDGLKTEHDVYNLKLYSYPVVKAPLQELAGRAINKCLDEAQLYQRLRFDGLVRPFTTPIPTLNDVHPDSPGFVSLVDYLKSFARRQKAEAEEEAEVLDQHRVEVEIQISKTQKPGYWTTSPALEPPFKGNYFRLTLYVNNVPTSISLRDFQKIAKLRLSSTHLDVITLIFGNVKKTVKDRRLITKQTSGKALLNWMAANLQDLSDDVKAELREAATKL